MVATCLDNKLGSGTLANSDRAHLRQRQLWAEKIPVVPTLVILLISTKLYKEIMSADLGCGALLDICPKSNGPTRLAVLEVELLTFGSMLQSKYEWLWSLG